MIKFPNKITFTSIRCWDLFTTFRGTQFYLQQFHLWNIPLQSVSFFSLSYTFKQLISVFFPESTVVISSRTESIRDIVAILVVALPSLRAVSVYLHTAYLYLSVCLSIIYLFIYLSSTYQRIYLHIFLLSIFLT
jgi:hypothetical protein